MISRIKRVLNSVTFRRILVIFVVGFVSRVLVNNFWDVNVFVDYLNSISLGYYGFMAIFVVLVNDFSYIDLKLLPKINMDVFSISSIRKAISVIISNLGNKGKVPISSGNGDELSGKVLDFLCIFGIIVLAIIVYIYTHEYVYSIEIDNNLDEIIELGYYDDYMEEPVEIYIYQDKSYFDIIKSLFKNSYKSYSLYTDYINSVSESTQYTAIKRSYIHLSEYNARPQVLSNILKYHLDAAYKHIDLLNEDISTVEIQRVKNNILLLDAINTVDRIKRGSPFLGDNSPIIGVNGPSLE